MDGRVAVVLRRFGDNGLQPGLEALGERINDPLAGSRSRAAMWARSRPAELRHRIARRR
jgi:hypothetical protein